jgi:ribose 5-phosphate isomerase RpiB
MLKQGMKFIRKNGRIIPIKAKKAGRSVSKTAKKVSKTVKKNKPKTLVEWGVAITGAGIGMSLLSGRNRKDK